MKNFISCNLSSSWDLDLSQFIYRQGAILLEVFQDSLIIVL